MRSLQICIKYSTIIFLFLALSVIPFHIAHADEVIMKDGSRLMGTVVSMKTNKLVFKTAFAGDITIKWDQVARLTTDNPVEVALGDQKTYKGILVQSDAGTIVVQPEKGPETAPLATTDIKMLSPPKPPPKWEFDGRVSLGASYEEGNTEKDTFNLDGQLELSKYPHRIRTNFEVSIEKSFNIKTDDNSLANLSYDRFLTENWFLSSTGIFEQDKFADLDSFWAVFVGPGYQFWKSKDDKNLSIAAGPGYSSEHYSKPQPSLGGQDSRDYAAAGWSFNLDWWLFKKTIQPFLTNTGAISLEDSSVWRTKIRTGIRFPMLYEVFGSVQYNWDWVNSPADGKKEYDEGVFIKLGYGW
jgi:hypothetical protein